MKKEAVRVSTTIPAAPTTVYFAWLSSEQHSAMTGGTAKIDPNVGGKFTAGNGYIQGKLVVLDLGRRIIMSWRTTDFPRDAQDSRVEVQFEALGGNTRLTLLHTDIPEGQGEKYRQGWLDNYLTPMRTHFSKYLPDPREPPPPRRPPPPVDDDGEEEEEEEEAEAVPPPRGAGKLPTKLGRKDNAPPTAKTPPARVPTPAKPSKAAPPATAPKPSKATTPTKPLKPPAAAKPAKSAKPANAAKGTKGGTPPKAAKPGKPAKAAKPGKPAKAAKPAPSKKAPEKAKPAAKPAAKAGKKKR